MVKIASRWVSEDGKIGFVKTDSLLGSNPRIIVYFGSTNSTLPLSQVSGSLYSFVIPIVDKVPAELSIDFEIISSNGSEFKYTVVNGKETDTSFSDKEEKSLPEMPKKNVVVEYYGWYVGFNSYRRVAIANTPLTDLSGVFFGSVTTTVNKTFHDSFHPIKASKADVVELTNSPSALFNNENLYTYVDEEEGLILIPVSDGQNAWILEFDLSEFYTRTPTQASTYNRYGNTSGNSYPTRSFYPTSFTSEKPIVTGYTGARVTVPSGRYYQNEIPVSFRRDLVIIETEFENTVAQVGVLDFVSHTGFEKQSSGAIGFIAG